MKLISPTVAIRQKKSIYRKTVSAWHFQNPHRMNKTVCDIIIASGRGWKRRNKPIPRNRKQFWERRNVEDIRNKNFCKTCLGAMRIGKD